MTLPLYKFTCFRCGDAVELPVRPALELCLPCAQREQVNLERRLAALARRYAALERQRDAALCELAELEREKLRRGGLPDTN